MCGRFTIRTSPREVAQLFEVDELPLFAPRYNVAPSQSVLAARLRGDGSRELVPLTWGFVPSWSKDPNSGNRPINIRSETALERPMFRSAFRQRRCLIAADGFFEWLAQGRAKQPYYFQRADGKPFAFAGVWGGWRREGQVLETCALFTTSANEVVAPIHDRMPVILEPADFATWLDPTNEDPQTLVSLLRPLPAAELTAQPVSPLVNSPRNDAPECIMPVETREALRLAAAVSLSMRADITPSAGSVASSAAELPVVSRPVMVAGNELLAYAESPPLIDDMVADIRTAQRRVWLETYTLADDVAGRSIAAALIDRAQAGLDVRVMYDAAGSPTLPTAFCAALIAAGVKLHAYHTIWDAFRRWSVLTVLNRRDHRKVLVVDEQIAYFGGMNIVDHGPTAHETGYQPPEQGWRDIHVRLRGPQASDFAESFVRSWKRAHHRPIRWRPHAYRRARLSNRTESIRLFDSGPGLKYSRAARVVMRLMKLARRRLVISIAYFLPTGRVLRALLRARRRGVRVLVIVPAVSDVKLVEWATRFLYDRLLPRGIRIYERRERMLHSKVMVVDRDWTLVGSCNLDPRSMWINLELLAVIRSRPFADEILRLCSAELRQSQRIRLSDHARLTWRQRWLHRLAWGLRWWL